MEYAINKQAIVDSVGYGYMIKNNQWSPPSNPGYNANLPSRDYDPAMAKQLLQQAGYANGIDVTLTYISGPGAAEALAVQQYCAAVGIRINLQEVDNAKFWNLCMTGWDGVLSVGYAIGPNFSSTLIGYFGPNRVIDKSTLIPDDIIAKANAALLEQDPTKAKAANDEVIKELYDICYLLPIESNAMGDVLSPKLHDSGIEDFSDWSEWSPENAWLEK
jgi:peptide/nickel transport system substrate-binding protein